MLQMFALAVSKIKILIISIDVNLTRFKAMVPLGIFADIFLYEIIGVCKIEFNAELHSHIFSRIFHCTEIYLLKISYEY